MTKRYDALQERIMTLYEEGSSSIDAQIELWDLIRKENVLCYYGRKEGYKNYGLQPLPNLAVCEYKAKEAIQQGILLKSLRDSPYGREDWTLNTTSAELTHTAPRNAFKKGPYTVDVYFDNNPDNSFPYTNWDALYVQDENDMWYKTPGKVDINGLYFEDNHGDKTYFTIFATDAQRYGTTGEWTVHYKNETLSTSITSSQATLSGSVQGSAKGSVSSTGDATSSTKNPRRREIEEREPSSTTPSSPDLRRGRRRGGEQRGEQREPRAKRRRTEESISGVSAGQVGRRHTTVSRTGLTRLSRLEAEARDPPFILVKGCGNNLKCWRYRFKKSNTLFTNISTVFRWVENDFPGCNHRMIITFKHESQRSMFLKTVQLPKGSSYALGSVDSL